MSKLAQLLLSGSLGHLRAHCRRLLRALMLMLSVFCLPAVARDWHIANFDSQIVIADDGEASVTEHITVVFNGSFQGIWRMLPVNYPGPTGSNYRLLLSMDSARGEHGEPLKYETSREGDYRKIKIYIPEAIDTTKTIVIRYTAANPVRFFDEHDEFYWNVTGNDWPVPIEAASARVIFPASAAGSLRAQAFTGIYGSVAQNATWEILGSEVTFRTRNPLPMRGGLTVDVYIPKGILRAPGVFTRAMWFLRGNAVMLLPVWTLLVMSALWWFRGRDPDPGRSVAPMYEPPKEMSPAEVGTLLDDQIHPRDITSTLIDLAVRGYIRIEEVEEQGLIFKSTDYIFHRVRPEGDWQALQAFERIILQQVFAGGDQTKLSWLKNRFYTAVPIVKQDIYAALKRKGMYWLDPESANAYTLLGLGISAAFFLLAKWLDLFTAPALLIGAIVVALIIVWFFGKHMSSKTLLGSKTWVAIRGFEEFIERVEVDKLRRMPPETFEKFLPYAMAFGLEQLWAQKFAGILQQAPSWYSGSQPIGSFNPIFFTNRMGAMANQAHQTFVAAPRASSTGSGFGGGSSGGGGGFSGGGFGGGGGGAF